MGIASGAFIAASPGRDGGTVAAPTTGSAHLCGIGCQIVNGSPFGWVMVVLVVAALAVALQRWPRRRGPMPRR